jgi:4-hydroxybenzoate polyprenyltransferase
MRESGWGVNASVLWYFITTPSGAPSAGPPGCASTAWGARSNLLRMTEPRKRGLARNTANYGDRDFALYLRRSFAKSMGYSQAMLERPVVGIVDTGSAYNNCHRTVPELIEAVTRGVLAAGGLPAWSTLGWILACMVTARSAAMAFNRWADAELDAANPRTRNRALPAGQLSPGFVLGFTVVMALAFLLAAAQLNRLTLLFAPGALAVVFFYSYTKRFTRWSHLFLGLALGIAPAAAWVAVRGSLDARILLLTAAVLCWVAGFDVLYACQDLEHDRGAGLNSIPQALGLERAFLAARLLHAAMIALLAAVAARLAVLPALRIGGVTVAHLPVAVADQSGDGADLLLGMDFICHVHPWIAHAARTLILQVPPAPSPPPGAGGPG